MSHLRDRKIGAAKSEYAETKYSYGTRTARGGTRPSNGRSFQKRALHVVTRRMEREIVAYEVTTLHQHAYDELDVRRGEWLDYCCEACFAEELPYASYAAQHPDAMCDCGWRHCSICVENKSSEAA